MILSWNCQERLKALVVIASAMLPMALSRDGLVRGLAAIPPNRDRLKKTLQKSTLSVLRLWRR